MGKSIMIQGSGSNVGKSLLVAGMCRAFWHRGLMVKPFKPQNMSNNAAVTEDGGEIGRAQALQAMAANIALHSDLNPVLLKPESDIGSQVILQGKRLTTVQAREYARLKPKLLNAVMDSFERVKNSCDLVIVEGAGSPAEVNLRAGDIANMGFAEAANVPVLLAGDIDRGGVIAQIVGTYAVLPKPDRDRIKGFVINKFRGDPTLFDDGLSFIVEHTGWHGLGVIPWFQAANTLPAEDVMDLGSKHGGAFKIAVPCLSRIANFDDLDPLKLDPKISIELVKAGQALPGDADLILIPGSKSTIADLAFFRAQGWDIDLKAHIRRGGHVLGICGGYQMLGREIIDMDGVEGPPARVAGLGHLDVQTRMQADKHTANVTAEYLRNGIMLQGYEIHMGHTTGPDRGRGWLAIGARREGAQSADGKIRGCYVHGLFSSDKFREVFLSELGHDASSFDYSKTINDTLDQLAKHLETHMDLDLILRLAK
ncbi:MAG: cobyric acid synthase [Alphaproteobacteria bacterium]|nr:cobyric acid synthase [Alphaproteobacteria bacterium]